MTLCKIFYSWQSDLPNNTNRGLINQVLENVTKALKAEDPTIEIILDQDTRDELGSPDIAETIFRKIQEADIFVADISIINSPSEFRPCPNPNVLIELGYALATHGHSRIVLINNSAYGKPEDAPFDIKGRTILSYACTTDQADKASVRKPLENALKGKITGFISAIKKGQAEAQRATEEQDVVQVIRAIEEGNPNQQKAVTQRYMKSFIKRVKAFAPVYKEDEPYEQPFLDAIGKATGLVAEFSNVAESIAQIGSLEAGKSIYKSFEKLADCYAAPQGVHHLLYRDFYYYKFMTHELFVTFFSFLVREEQWKFIDELLSQDLYINNIELGRSGEYPYGYLSQHVELFDLTKHADILKERHSQEPLQSLVPAQDFMETDYLLYLRLSVSNGVRNKDRDWQWWPRCVSFMYSNPPRFLQRMEKNSFALELLPVFGVNDIATLKARLSDLSNRSNIFFREPRYKNPLTSLTIDAIATE